MKRGIDLYTTLPKKSCFQKREIGREEGRSLGESSSVFGTLKFLVLLPKPRKERERERGKSECE